MGVLVDIRQKLLSMLEASSYESLPLSLMMGINGALFLQPIANYGSEEAKREVFNRVINNAKMGGLMITEPNYGSEALKMQTSVSIMLPHSYIMLKELSIGVVLQEWPIIG